MGHNYAPDEGDVLIESTSNLQVHACSRLSIVTISDQESGHCEGYIHLMRNEAIATARAILKHFGEGLE